MAKKKEEKLNEKTKQIIDKTFKGGIHTFKDEEVKEIVTSVIKEDIRSNPDYDNVMISLYTQDVEKKHWRKKEHFTKIFRRELDHLREYYSITNAEKNFIYDLSEFLKWEMNILVDEEDNPLNQQLLAEILGTDRKTIGRKMKSLSQKGIIYIGKLKNEQYYIMNPYICYCGQNVNIFLPKLFDELGYINSTMVDSSGRSNRRKAQQKRLDTL